MEWRGKSENRENFCVGVFVFYIILGKGEFCWECDKESFWVNLRALCFTGLESREILKLKL